MITILFLLIMFFNTQIAYVITKKESRNLKFHEQVIMYIISFFMWPMYVMQKYIDKL